MLFSFDNKVSQIVIKIENLSRKIAGKNVLEIPDILRLTRVVANSTVNYMENMNQNPRCILCGGQNFTKLFAVNRYSINKCFTCRLVQTYPINSEEAVETLYDQSYFDDLIQHKQQELYYHKRLLDLIERYKTTGKMLEVGVGIGTFMELAHFRGWDIQGVEPSGAACQYVADALDLPVYHGTLQTAHFPQNHFDVITFRHVLEHITDPRTFFKEVQRILKDDGIIGLAVPNFGGLHSRIEKEEWFHLSVPHHVAHYTKHTLKALVISCDFAVLTLKTADLSCSSYLRRLINWFLPLFKRQPMATRVNPRDVDPTINLHHWLLSREVIVNEFMAKLGLGDEIVMIARKI
jgi:2-polyprenyl-3-methyl-5-hydroxy-6-metoxy-1,4-benzoquinol methylase